MYRFVVVSTLTQPQGRVQHDGVFYILDVIHVSTLTQPQGRVQRRARLVERPTISMFQPSPNLKAGCNIEQVMRHLDLQDSFNPHPTSRPGATSCAPVNVPLPQCFNPHPTSRPGATIAARAFSLPDEFQPSPNLKAGCN